ncbi:ASCH domain-containing protein [Dehalococcoides mccartyi]|nr:ASCH domain-containing protein [Dehalococcoides mccartyi]
MLLFKEQHVAPILDGTKTQTRRLWPHGRRVKLDSTHIAKTVMMDPKSAFARIKISDVFQESLSDISQDDALAEGYSTIQRYLDAFATINRLNDRPSHEIKNIKVWVVKFEVVESMRF